MAKKSMKDVAEKMRKLDICMVSSQTARGLITSRPMSNNGDVEYDGNSYFFTWDDSQLAKDITENPQVNLAFSGPKNLYISVVGKAKLVKNKTKMAEHWLEQLNMWFKKGIETPGAVMVHVKANRIKYWQNEEEGEVKF